VVCDVFDGAHFIDEPPLQDVDLLQRLNQYFETLDFRLRHGQGWVIYNASGPRANRITQFMQEQLRSAEIPFSHYFLPWRDFALTSYLVQVEMQDLPQRRETLSEHSREEYEIAARVSRQTLARMVTADLLIVNGLMPQHEHELHYLEQTIDRRCGNRLATILLTPEQPHELASDVTRLSESRERWDRLATRLYETSLIAL
jgi:hypothetical protein